MSRRDGKKIFRHTRDNRPKDGRKKNFRHQKEEGGRGIKEEFRPVSGIRKIKITSKRSESIQLKKTIQCKFHSLN